MSWFDFIPNIVLHLILLGGVVGTVLTTLFSKIPFVGLYLKQIRIASIVALLLGLWFNGYIAREDFWQQKFAQMKLEAAQREAESTQATVRVVTKYIDRTTVIKDTSDATIKAIPQLIGKDADAACNVPNGFVVLHDSAAKGEVPDTSGDANEKASGVKISEVGKVVTENYTACHQNAEQLKSLQDWLVEQQRIYK
jgi:hypothetical protein